MTKYSIPVWQMALNVLKELGGDKRWVSLKEIKRKVHEAYPTEKVKDSTINLQLSFHSINHSTRVHSPSKQWMRKPLFKTDNSRRFMILSEDEKVMFNKACQIGLGVVNKPFYSMEELKTSLENKEEILEANLDEVEEEFKSLPGYKTEFALEEQLETYIVSNWSSVDFGHNLELYGRQYSTSVGIIDLLCIDKDNNDFVIIELKKGKESDKVLGQLQRYMGWVKKNLAKEGQNIRGIIITGEYDGRLSLAASTNPNIKIKYYGIKFWLKDEPQ
jgi:hypothetical protein